MIISVFDRVENIMGKGENAGYQHFLLFPQCFQRASFPDVSKGVIVWEWVNWHGFNVDEMILAAFDTGLKTLWKRRKSPFPPKFSKKDFFPVVVKSWDHVLKS